MIQIKPVEFSRVFPFIDVARKDGIRLDESFHYIAYLSDGKVCGFCAYTTDGRKATFRNDFVHPTYRRRGIYREMNHYRMNLVRSLGITTVEVNCKDTSLAFHVKNGARITRTFKHTTRVLYENIQEQNSL